MVAQAATVLLALVALVSLSCSIVFASSSSTNGVVVSWRDPFVLSIPDFLTPEECSHVIDLTQSLAGYNETKPVNTLYFDRRRGQYSDPLLQEIELKIGALLGWHDHPDQESLCVHRIAADPESQLRVRNVHHDKANKPFTTATVIVYLQDVEDGGETIWPCTASEQLRQTCRSVYTKGARWYNGERTVMEGQVHWVGQHNAGTVEDVEHELNSLLTGTSDLCSRRNETGFDRLVVHTKPTRGTAVLFRHDLPGGGNLGWVDGDPESWHCGCKVYKGVKWTMQKFAEVPGRVRKSLGKPQAAVSAQGNVVME